MSRAFLITFNQAKYLAFFYHVFIVQIYFAKDVSDLTSFWFFSKTTGLEERKCELELQEELKDAGDDSSKKESIMTRKHYLHLEKYYRQSLSQSSKIFGFGIFLALFGLAIIPAMMYFKLENVAVLGIAQAILTAFVLVIFQQMYAKTNKSVTTFYNGLLKKLQQKQVNKRLFV